MLFSRLMCFTVYFELALTAVGVVLTLNVDVRGRERGNRSCRGSCGS